MKPWRTLDRVKTAEGMLELRQRDARDFLITVDGRVLMTSVAHRSEDDLARVAAAAAAPGPWRRVLVGGLGMGYTLRAALDGLPRDGQVTVAELNVQVVEWCKGPLAVLTDGAAADPRVRMRVANVTRVIGEARPGHYDAILLDLYEGPHHAANRGDHDPLYGRRALSAAWTALRPGGVLAVWSEETDTPFEKRLLQENFNVKKHRGGGGRQHLIYVAVRGAPVAMRRRQHP